MKHSAAPLLALPVGGAATIGLSVPVAMAAPADGGPGVYPDDIRDSSLLKHY